MDVWAWVFDAMTQLRDDGHDRLAGLLADIPAAVLGADHAAAEAMCAEALALAGGVGLPWIPVYVRHWQLQGRVAERGLGAVTLTDAVAALELAHRPEAAGCPQAVCTVQDLVICYGRTDGPGWGNERIEVLDETLAGITKDWPCWRCLTNEKADALFDLGRPAEALDLLRQRGPAEGVEGVETDVAALVELGRADEAIDLAERWLRRRTRDTERTRAAVRTHLALAYLAAGRVAEARETLPDADDDALREYAEWARAAELLVAAGELTNDHELGAAVWELYERKLAWGCWYDAARVLLSGTRLAVARGRGWVARRGVEALDDVLAKLRDPARLADQVVEVRAAVAAMPPVQVELPGDVDGLAELPPQPDPEAALDLREAAYRRWPDQPRVADWYARALLASGHRAAAVRLLDEFVRRDPGDHPAAVLLAAVLLDAPVPDEAAVTALAELLREPAPGVSRWTLARLAQRGRDWAGCVEHCRALLEIDPSRDNTRRLMAFAAGKAGDHDLAVEVLDGLREQGEWTEDDDWDLLVPATITGRWDRVRETAARLGMPVEPGEGPIDEEWHYLVLRYDDGEELEALRTGPVTARVDDMGFPDDPMRYGDLVVFAPGPLEPPPEEGPTIFGPVATLREGGYRAFEFEGYDPGEPAMAALRAALEARGCALRTFSQTEPPEDPLERTIYVTLAVPGDADLPALHALLLEQTGEWRTFGWPDLAAAAGDRETAERQAAAVAEI